MRIESTAALSQRSETRRRSPRPAATSAAPTAAAGHSGKPVRGSSRAFEVLEGVAVVAVGVGVAAGADVCVGAVVLVGAGVVLVLLFFLGWLGTFEKGSWYWLSPALSASAAAGIASAMTEQATAISGRRSTRAFLAESPGVLAHAPSPAADTGSGTSGAGSARASPSNPLRRVGTRCLKRISGRSIA